MPQVAVLAAQPTISCASPTEHARARRHQSIVAIMNRWRVSARRRVTPTNRIRVPSDAPANARSLSGRVFTTTEEALVRKCSDQDLMMPTFYW